MKTKTIISVNQEAIDKHKDKLKVTAEYCSTVYSMFTGIDIPIKIEDINELVFSAKMGGRAQQVEALIIKRLLELPKNKLLAGLNGSQLKHKLEIPDYQGILSWIDKSNTDCFSIKNGMDVSFLHIKDGKVKALPNADDLLKDKYTNKTVVPDYEAINKQ